MITSTEPLLTTGQVAERLGSSRQHVVDMCERGDLEFIRVGKHRRIPSHQVESLLGRSTMDRDALRSLWLHRVVASRLMIEPTKVIENATKTIDRRIAKSDYNGSPKPYYLRWKQILQSGVEETAKTLVDTTEESNVLRSCSPFVGVITQEERSKIIGSFNAYWDKQVTQE